MGLMNKVKVTPFTKNPNKGHSVFIFLHQSCTLQRDRRKREGFSKAGSPLEIEGLVLSFSHVPGKI
jgi:hypothetical protein